MTVSLVAIASDGRVSAVLPRTRHLPIVNLQQWCDRQQDAGYRVAAWPGCPKVGVVLAEPVADAGLDIEGEDLSAGAAADAEPSRAEGDEQQQHCRWCGNWLPSCWWDPETTNHLCVHVCAVGAMRREQYFRATADAEGAGHG